MKAGFPQPRPSSTLASLSNSAAIWPTREERDGEQSAAKGIGRAEGQEAITPHDDQQHDA
jgi:hypothetical protein